MNEDLQKSDITSKAHLTGLYTAAFIGTATLIPVIATLASAALYIALPQFPWQKLSAALGGTLLALFVWSLLALSYHRSTAIDRADAYSYNLLLIRLYRLEAWLDILDVDPRLSNKQVFAIGLNEVRTFVGAARRTFVQPSPSWMSAIGYVNLSRLLHRAEEALILIEPVDAVFVDASPEEINLENSTLENKDYYLMTLRRALKRLDPAAAIYLMMQPPLEPPSWQDFSFDPDPNPRPTLDASSQKESEEERKRIKSNESFNAEMRARTMVREVKSSLNRSFDDQWEKLIRVRNHLLRMTILTGLVLYILTEIALISGIQVSTLLSATFFFLIGAAVGLFSRLYEQSQVDTSIDNIRLAVARLMAAPLFSGLAAIGGVLVTQKLATPGSNNPFEVLNVFNILIAATFGLAPNLFFNAIQRQADQYKTNLKKVQTSAY